MPDLAPKRVRRQRCAPRLLNRLDFGSARRGAARRLKLEPDRLKVACQIPIEAADLLDHRCGTLGRRRRVHVRQLIDRVGALEAGSSQDELLDLQPSGIHGSLIALGVNRQAFGPNEHDVRDTEKIEQMPE